MLRLLICVIFFLFVSACGIKSATQYDIIYNGEKEQRIKEKVEQSKNFTIALVPKLEGISYFNAVKEGAMEAAMDLGVNVIYKGPKNATWEQQEEIIEGLIEQKVDVIAISANDPKKLGPVLNKAKQRNIKVITWDSDTDHQLRELFINMVDPEMLGRNLMDTLAWKLGEEGTYAIMTASLSTSNLNEWIHWVKVQQQDYYPKMKLIDIVETDEDPDKAYMKSMMLLEKYPELNGVVAVSTINPPAIAKAVQEDEKIGEIAITGVSTPNLMRSYIEEGVVDSITLWSPQKLGYLTVSLAKNLVEGDRPYDGQRIQNVGNIRVHEDIVIMGHPIDFTKENIEQYDF